MPHARPYAILGCQRLPRQANLPKSYGRLPNHVRLYGAMAVPFHKNDDSSTPPDCLIPMGCSFPGQRQALSATSLAELERESRANLRGNSKKNHLTGLEHPLDSRTLIMNV